MQLMIFRGDISERRNRLFPVQMVNRRRYSPVAGRRFELRVSGRFLTD